MVEGRWWQLSWFGMDNSCTGLSVVGVVWDVSVVGAVWGTWPDT